MEDNGEMLNVMDVTNLRPGAVVGSYTVIQKVDEGGMGLIYQMRHRYLHTIHAVKLLRPEYVFIPDARTRFLREGRIQAGLIHPNIVRVTDIITNDGRGLIAGLVMDWLNGVNLQQYVETHHPLSIEAVHKITEQVLSALKMVHAHEITHRDIKPENIFVEATGRAILMDFGIARYLSSEHTQAQQMLATPGFASIQQLNDPSSVNTRDDIFSMGCVLYFLFSGQRPFQGGSSNEINARVQYGDYQPLNVACPHLHDDLVQIVHRALSSERDARFKDASALTLALEDTTSHPRNQPSPQTILRKMIQKLSADRESIRQEYLAVLSEKNDQDLVIESLFEELADWKHRVQEARERDDRQKNEAVFIQKALAESIAESQRLQSEIASLKRAITQISTRFASFLLSREDDFKRERMSLHDWLDDTISD